MSRALPLALLPLAALVLGACGGRGDTGGVSPPPAPNLSGAAVMLFPVQTTAAGADLEGELTFWLTDRAARTVWITRDELEAVVDRTPGWRIDLEALPPGVAEVRGQMRVRDPLYGAIRRLSAVMDARFAFIPYARRTADSAGVALEMTGVLLDAHGGRVIWMGTVRGEASAPGEPLRSSSAAEALARALVPL